MEIIFNYFWVFLIVFGIINGLSWKRNLLKERTLSDEEEFEFDSLIKGFIIWGTLPWIIMGITSFVFGVSDFRFLVFPNEVSKAYLVFYVTVILLNGYTFIWINFLGGAEKLARYPGIMNHKSAKPISYKLLSYLGILANVAFFVMVYYMDFSKLFDGIAE